VFQVEPAIVFSAALLAILAGVLGTSSSLRRAMAIPPSVAMVREVPVFRPSLLDRLGLVNPSGRLGRMTTRNLTQHPLSSLLGLVGMALAVAVVILGNSVADSSKRMRDVRYQAEERQDLTVSLLHRHALGTARDFSALPGVLRVEPLRVVPARLLVRGSARDVTIFGLPEGGVLRQPVANSGQVARVPGRGALLTAAVARALALRRGDLLTLEIRENQRRTVSVGLVGVSRIRSALSPSAHRDWTQRRELDRRHQWSSLRRRSHPTALGPHRRGSAREVANEPLS
jgi:putative ABC transport system permease protein